MLTRGRCSTYQWPYAGSFRPHLMDTRTVPPAGSAVSIGMIAYPASNFGQSRTHSGSILACPSPKWLRPSGSGEPRP